MSQQFKQGWERILAWRADPLLFVRENFFIEPDEWQKQFLKALASKDKDKVRISLNACAGPGKTAALAWAAWWFLVCWGREGNHPKGVAIAVTRDNLKDNLWPELSKWQSHSSFLKAAFTWTKERIYANDHPETWFLSARSWSKDADAETQGRTLSGIHSDYVFFIIDESGDIPVTVLKSAEQALGNTVFGKIVQAGNPTSHEGMLYAAYSTLRHLWHVICITGDPEDPDRSPRIDIEWARQQIETYGRDNPWVMSYILGKFPESSLNTLLSPDEVHAAMNRRVDESQFEFSQKRIGIDVAYSGLDSTVIFPRQGLISYKPIQMRTDKPSEIAGRAMNYRQEFNYELCYIDDTGGFGRGVIDFLQQTGQTPIGVHFSGKADDPQYYNKRAEIWFRMAQWVKNGGSLPNLPILVRELCAPQYFIHNGKLQLEDKEQIKKRLQFSPDHGDALALTFTSPDMPASMSHLMGENIQLNNHVSDYDPYS